MHAVLAAARQWQFPAPLRIAEHDTGDAAVQTAEVVLQLADLVDGLADAGVADRKRLQEEVDDLQKLVNSHNLADSKNESTFISKLATASWSLEQAVKRLDVSGTGRAVRNRVDAMSRLLKANQIEIEDFSGAGYDPGELWDQVMGDQKPKSNPVIESMQTPRVRWKGEIIQRGIPNVEEGGA